ncbi:LOW QUALITY PROTEIN: mitogen-activated protein kinase kinase kinase kinase 4-like [Portunus trituberculatus]|uniref:LOW QUALITY PROTEIN: mitogen-activated protein kinase kinase kinase kinase 4-like n=1 Tax=Portunus trituberculatus TaxID=210409 RepID=UPI001E1CB170|nr:LOW QUALITY PROTEIN: mitogen-activated protein kinase kinase kinase kinase 4-like [Portunus trituberculatus]
MNEQGEDSDSKCNDKNNNFVDKEKKMPRKCKKKRKMILVDEREPVGELPPPFPPRNIKVKEEDDMRDFYDIKKEIGRGRFGTVYLVEDKKTRQKFAAKFVNTRRNQDRANVEREVEIMKTLNAEAAHPRLIQLYDAYDMEKEMCLVLEIVDGGELFERVINDDFVLTERACTVFVKQICEGVEFIHSKNILHLDMKPENILCLSREGNRVKICDFGLARKYDPRKKLQVLFGTPEFVAPEVVNFEPIGFGTDMWSVGVICYVLLSGLSPFMGHNYVETMTNVTHNKYDFDDEAFDCVSEEAKEFIQKLLVLDKSMRPTPAQCLRSPWLRSPPPPKYHPLSRRFPSSASNSEEEEEEEEEESESESSEEEEEVIKVDEILPRRIEEEEETEKYSVRRRRRKQEEEEEKARKRKEAEEGEERKRKEVEEEEERKRKEMEAKRKDLERQIEEKKKKIAEEEERCKRMREEEEEAKRKKEEEEVRRKKEEEEARRKEEEERRRQEEEAKRKEEEERRKKEREEEERRKRKEEEARKKKEEEEARRRQKEEEEEVRRKELETEKKRKEEEEIKRRAAEEKRRKEEEELERSKAQLREFVARWNSHPNSPYVVVAEDVPRGLEGARGASGASLTSVAVQPPSDLSHDDLDDEEAAAGDDEEFIHYTISAPLKGPASPPQVARCLEARLNLLQRQDATEDGKSGGKTSGRSKGGRSGGGRGSRRGEKRRSSSRSPSSGVLHDTEEAETIIKQILSSDHRSAYEEYQRMVGAMDGSGHLQRPEVVALQQEEGGTRRRTRTDSTSKHSRRQPSRDVPTEDRPPSRERNRSPAPPAHRRPSRDVPLSPSQMERIARSAPQAWPDLIVAPQDEADDEVRQFSLDVPVASLHKSPSGTLRSVPGLKVSADPEPDATPAARRAHAPKGAPSLTPPPSPPSENYSKPALSPPPSPTPAHKTNLAPTPSPTPSSATDRKASLTPPPSPVPSHKDSSMSSEDPPSRLVEWILDIGTRTPPREQSTSSLQDRVTQWEARDAAPRPSPSPSRRLSPSPRPSPSTSPSRRSSASGPAPVPVGVNKEGPAPSRRPQAPLNVLSQDDSSAENVIHTPWGALKRSPSKTSFSKSPSREREASPTSRGRTPSPREPAPASRQEDMNGWGPGGKSFTLPRSAKLLRQKSMVSMPGQGDAASQDADGSLKRKGKFPPSPNKRPLTPLLFTAQDRISMFEKQQPTDTRGPPRPLARTRSSVTLGGTASTDPRADRSQVGFMKTKLLSKLWPGAAPTLPEEPASPSPARPKAA